MIALKYFVFEEDFLYGTENMFLWFRSAIDDLEDCPQNSVKGVSEKIWTKLVGLSQADDYFFILL